MIGLFIGSFNPPTKAHLEISLKLLDDLDKIVFIPVNSMEKELVSMNDRINMLTLFTKKHTNLIIDDIMKNYSYLNYRIIDLLKDKYKNVTIIMGSDLLDKLDTFDNYLYLLNNYSYVVIERSSFPSIDIINKKYLDYKNKFTIIDYQSDISSTKVRKLLKEGKDTTNMLDKDILNYIKEHNLY